MYLVDTDVMIDIQRGHAPALVCFASVSELPSIPGFVVMELIQDAQNKQQVRKVLQMVAPLQLFGLLKLIVLGLCLISPLIICPTRQGKRKKNGSMTC
jgi:hypothetical protein